MEQKLVIVIPTKNRLSLLKRALKSVFDQNYKNFRVVIVNDGANDGTKEYLDSLHGCNVLVIHHKNSMGVNASRNEAFKTLKNGEWAVQLDDDDFFIDCAFKNISNVINSVPNNVEVLCFNSTIRTPREEFTGGYKFDNGEEWYEPTYADVFTGFGLKMRGDNRAVWKWTVFPDHLFFEGVNGFEHMHWMELARDGVVVRFVPDITTVIDQDHGQGHLSNIAAKGNPKSFAMSHKKIFKDHKEFFIKHPEIGLSRAFHALKISVRALSIRYILFFGFKTLEYLIRNIFIFLKK